MKRLLVGGVLLSIAATSGCSGSAGQAASEATGKAQEIRNEKRAEARDRALKSHQVGRRGADHR